MPRDYRLFSLGDVALQSGETLQDARLAYATYGVQKRGNVVVLPTFYTGSHRRNLGFFGDGRAIDPARHFIVSINLFGNGFSTSPGNAKQHGAAFPRVTLHDNVFCQRRLLREVFGIEEIALVAGWSMAGCQAYQWAAQYPEEVRAILPFCASAKTSIHNHVFLEGVKAALCADAAFNGGRYKTAPVAGLKAFARVYAGWAFSQTFYREQLFRRLGFDSAEALLQDWEADHVKNWDANNLLAKLDSWQTADISANSRYNGDFAAALAAIQARAILMPCAQDLYFPPQDNELEAQVMPNADCRPFDSPWGHCAASPGNDPAFTAALEANLRELLE